MSDSTHAERRPRWMSLREIWFVYRARMRSRQTVVQELLGVLGLAVGVALLFASQVASTSLNGSVRQLTAQIIGSTQLQVQARGPEGFSSRVAGEVTRVPGVRKALPLLEQPATVRGPGGEQAVDLLGISPGLLRSGGELLRRFSATELAHQQALALPAPLAASLGVGPLQPVQIRLGDRSMKALVAATLSEADIGELIHSPAALAPLAYAQSLSGMGHRLTRVFVQVQPGHLRQVRAALGGIAQRNQANVEPATAEAKQFEVAAGPQNQSEGLFAAISALVGFLFAFNALLLTVPPRRQMIEVLRLRGNTRAMSVQLLAAEALMLGAVACVVGLALGDLLSAEVFHSTPGYLAFAFPVGSPRIVTWQAVALSVAGGIAAALVGVIAPMRDLLRPPLDSRKPARSWTRQRLLVSAVCLAVTTVILVARPQSAVVAMCTLLLALVCVLPTLFDGALSALEWMPRLLPIATASPKLAAVELRDHSTRMRSLAVAATGAIAVFGAVSIQGSKQNLQEGLNRTATEVNDTASIWVSVGGQSNALATTPFSGSAIASKLRALPDVRTVTDYRGGFLTVGSRRVWVLAPAASRRLVPAGQLLAGDPQIAAARVRTGRWAVISQALAGELHLHIGDSLMLPAPHPTVLRVAALSTNMGWPPGAIVISAESYARAWGSTEVSALNLTLRGGISPSAARSEAVRALGVGSGMSIQAASQRAHMWEAISAKGLARLDQIATLVLVAAILAITGVLGSMLWQRRPHIAYVKRQGYSKALLWRTLLCECMLLVLTGALAGAAFGLYGQLVLSHALASVTGFPVIVGVGVIVPIVSGASVCVTALAILAVPGYLTVQARPSVASPA